MEVEYHPLIESELRQIINYYNSSSSGLGLDFINDFEKQVFKIASMPTRWRKVEDDIRRSLMKRFPYIIYFRIINRDRIRVILVKHERQHPNYGKGRN